MTGTLIFWLAIALVIVVAYVVLAPKFTDGPSPYARIMAAHIDITTLQNCLAAFHKDNGYYLRGTNGLLALMQKPDGATNWHGPYFDPPQLPIDPWGNAYQYAYPGKHNPTGYDLWSAGPDGKSGDADDIRNWQTQ
jgi:general secretion pathway protein G